MLVSELVDQLLLAHRMVQKMDSLSVRELVFWLAHRMVYVLVSELVDQLLLAHRMVQNLVMERDRILLSVDM